MPNAYKSEVEHQRYICHDQGDSDKNYFGELPAGMFLSLFVVHDNLAVENLLLDTFVEIVRHGPDEHSSPLK